MTSRAIPLLIALAVLLPGCVERRIYIRSEPAGADVYIDGEYVGRTRAEDHVDGPLYANFVFYGTREYTIRKPGYETASGVVKLETPWYEYPPLDFFAEVLVPYPIVDEHFVEVTMEKAESADVDALYARARRYRYNSRPEDRYEYAFLRMPFGDRKLPKPYKMKPNE
ncbi:MAG: PEGA domain-containing protein [Planctomycetes bacterium]|nr:PEGA domain-containing protein [Planctomycetota bacterium]